ncbi:MULTISPECIES: DMT family transporter [unclassified Ruegeria]|uniref:DMT family transporter n=1 Tax=unclassified Ruegeria TaxID=2625375 RepID=UPI0014883F9B|nr:MULTISPECIES: DMT family transporter [unclassified Ruegeria]NOD76218.1 EamA family transporter [Ruegeria sp. HKCCD4332]NOD90175.1 EamA family transporter [Ruegeria sp. HKCCD4318]NOE15248.1 EamA family transporter [Ruegeria sp. HKCCD4318-2]NOG10542.1 DMT family transporter [Ruegeria sp. HKCCD4315]
MSTQNTTLRGLGFAFAGFAVFASHDALIKVLGGTYSVMQIIFFATLFSFVPMAVSMLADRTPSNFRPHHPWLVLLRSGLVVTSMVCAFYAFSVLPLAEVYSLLFSFPLIVTVLSIPILGEVVRIQRWAAVGVGLIGVLIVLRPGATDITLGHLAALTAAFCSAFGSVLVRKIGNEERSAVLILYPMLLAILVMSLAQPAVYQPPSLLHLAMMALVGVFSVIAQHLIILAYRAAPAGVVAPSQYSQIIWATIFGMVFFGEHPDGWVAVGASIIIASGVFVVWRESRSNTTSVNTPVLRVRSPRSDTGASRPGK